MDQASEVKREERTGPEWRLSQSKACPPGLGLAALPGGTGSLFWTQARD